MAFRGNYSRIIGLLHALRREILESPLNDDEKGVIVRATDRHIYRIRKAERRLLYGQLTLPFQGEDVLLLM